MWKLLLTLGLIGLVWAMFPDEAQSKKDGKDFYCKYARYKESTQYKATCH